MTWLKDKIVAAWLWSRTVFLNVLSALSMVGGDIVGVLLGYDWGTVISSRWAGLMVLGLNVLNIVLRLDTRGPVGGKG